MGYCVYCGEWRELTRDHIPPRSLFPKPRPSDLITVPSCYFCNHGASEEDEHFNFMVKLGIDRNKSRAANADSVKAIHNLSRPECAGFRSYLMQRYQPDYGSFVVERKRVDAVLRRIVRGLFYRSVGMRLPEFVPFQFVSLSDQPRRAAALSDVIDMLLPGLKTIGGGVFRYSFAQCAPPDPFVTAWLLTFYDHRSFFCFTSKPL